MESMHPSRILLVGGSIVTDRKCYFVAILPSVDARGYARRMRPSILHPTEFSNNMRATPDAGK